MLSRTHFCMQLLKTCDDIRSHIVRISSKKEYNDFIVSESYELTSLNGSLIHVNHSVSKIVLNCHERLAVVSKGF